MARRRRNRRSPRAPQIPLIVSETRWLMLLSFGLAVLALVLVWPMLGPGSPPGVDAPTFLHLAWVADLALTGGLDNIWSDPYWYGGWPYAAAYPPLAYGAIGVISAASPVPIEIAYRIVIVLALAGVGSSVVLLGREFGLTRWTAGAAGGITLLMYPILAGVGLWGWQATLVALPFALSSVAMLQRSVEHGRARPAVIAGVLMGVSLLAHHMTAFAFTLGLVGWAIARLAPRGADRMWVVRALALAGALAWRYRAFGSRSSWHMC